MELFLFLFFFFATIALIAIGLRSGNFLFVLLGSVLCIGLGALLLSEGIITDKISSFSIDDTNSFAPISVTPTYKTYSGLELPIGIMGNLLFYGGIICLLYTLYLVFIKPKALPGDL